MVSLLRAPPEWCYCSVAWVSGDGHGDGKVIAEALVLEVKFRRDLDALRQVFPLVGRISGMIGEKRSEN